MFDLHDLLFGEEDATFLAETMLRSLIMFVVILIGLRTLGKRGVTQLSVFELGVIIGLGSAAGDPMFYKDVGLLVGMVVLLVVLALYKLVTFLINRSDKIEQFMEGKPTTVIMNGCILLTAFDNEPIARDELFSELRLQHISHLGQVRQAIIETNGEVSAFYFEDKEVVYGLPLLPEYLEHQLTSITKNDHYACAKCGNVEDLKPTKRHECKVCKGIHWVQAIDERRVT